MGAAGVLGKSFGGQATHDGPLQRLPGNLSTQSAAHKGFGFIQPDDRSKDVFVHISAVERAGLGTQNEKRKTSFDVEKGNIGKVSATNLKTA